MAVIRDKLPYFHLTLIERRDSLKSLRSYLEPLSTLWAVSLSSTHLIMSRLLVHVKTKLF